MALRTFHANPSLGGFGGESSSSSAPRQVASSLAPQDDCDAFAQIVKELVDNAVDACQQDSLKHNNNNKRIRVVIEQMNHHAEEHYPVLRVTVSDNGVGMSNVESSVNAFRTSKANNEHSSAGRYGIGLTLCLLHAQRLVPNSCASITSATKESSRYVRASFVVDTMGDSVKCVKQEQLPKNSPEESGTAVSLLVPGGPTAVRAWPRLAEYFARFQLSFGLKCGLQVLAPSLSTVPLYIRPNNNSSTTTAPTTTTTTTVMEDEKDQWTDGLSEEEEQPDLFEKDENDTVQESTSEQQDATPVRRLEILTAAHAFLKQPVQLENIAHASHPIGRISRHVIPEEQPTLDVSVICYQQGDHDDDEEEQQQDDCSMFLGESPSAKCMLVRMVNGVPLLDSAEASACGLVQGMVQQQSTWNSFGLHITQSSCARGQHLPTNFDQDDDDSSSSSGGGGVESQPLDHQQDLFVPTFGVRDSTQVAPFLQSGIHDLYELNQEEENLDAASMLHGRHGFLPAHLRIGNILVIVQIHAKPSSLPLPTLSKGRLPMNNHSITSALELGITDCLANLQKTNPGLLLTSTQLKETIRDSRYVPALSAALANVVCKSRNAQFQSSMVQTIQKWLTSTNSTVCPPDEMQQEDDDSNRSEKRMVPRVISMDPSPSESASMQDDDDDMTHASTGAENVNAVTLCPLLERRLRLVCAPKKRSAGRRGPRRKTKHGGSDSDDAVSLDEFLESGWEGPVRDSEMQEDNDSTVKESCSEQSRSASSHGDSNVARNEPSVGRRLNADEDDFDDDSWF